MIKLPVSIPARIPFTDEDVDAAVEEFRKRLKKAVEKHGAGCCWSTHEASGVIAEEIHEQMLAQHAGDLNGFRDELYDGMIANCWGIISIDKDVIRGKW